MCTFSEKRLKQLEKDLKPGEIIVYDPCSFIPYISGKGSNRTCGDCGKTNCLNLYYETEWGRLNHGVCHSCWCTRGTEECEGGLIGSVYDGITPEEGRLLESLGVKVDYTRVISD